MQAYIGRKQQWYFAPGAFAVNRKKTKKENNTHKYETSITQAAAKKLADRQELPQDAVSTCSRGANIKLIIYAQRVAKSTPEGDEIVFLFI